MERQVDVDQADLKWWGGGAGSGVRPEVVGGVGEWGRTQSRGKVGSRVGPKVVGKGGTGSDLKQQEEERSGSEAKPKVAVGRVGERCQT